jgi:hypothetical protein
MKTEVEWMDELAADPTVHPTLRAASAEKARIIRDGLKEMIEIAERDGDLTLVGDPHFVAIIGIERVMADCEHAVWIAPSTQQLLKHEGNYKRRLLCTACWGKEA